MTPELRQQLRALYGAASAIPPAQRSAWLDQSCPDPQLRAELESLLAGALEGSLLSADTAASAAAATGSSEDTQLEATLAPDLAADPAPFPADDLLQRRLGDFRVLRLIGAGGMGAVYLAERVDGSFEQQVAVKVVQRGLASDAAVRRFLRERQILGRLNHRHICSIIGGGVSDDGRPYLVMPFLEGALPLDDFCDREQCDQRRRLQMFLAICDAVQHAHQNLVVHSDLKPANILVTPAGDIQLLDFGIARLLDPGQSGATTMHEGGRPLTPQYASPEQIEGHSPTTLSDVYSLGVLLYRMLTDTLPYRFDRTTLREMAEQLASTDTAAPSSRRPGIAEDLDNIVLKAMAREPERRYVSAAALAEDIQRWLDGQPVLARPATLSYHLRKFIRRHRWPVATVVLGLLALSALTLVLALSNARIAAQATQLQLERDRAEATAEFWAQLFEQADPVRVQSAANSTRELLDRARLQLGDSSPLSRPIRTRLLVVISTAYWNLAEADGARAAAEQAVALQRADDPPTETAVLAYKQLANIAMSLAELELARSAAERAISLLELLPDASLQLRAQALDALALVLDAQGDTAAAAAALEQTVAIQRQLPAEQIRVDLATALGNLGYMYYRLGSLPGAAPEQLERAEALVEESLALLRLAFGEDHPRVGFMLNAAGVLNRARGDYVQAGEHFAHAARIAAQSLPDGHDLRVRLNLNRAEMLLAQGDWHTARESYRTALGAAEATLPDAHPDRIAQQLGLARSALALRDEAAAEQALSTLEAQLSRAEADLPTEQLWARLLRWRLSGQAPEQQLESLQAEVLQTGDAALIELHRQLSAGASIP